MKKRYVQRFYDKITVLYPFIDFFLKGKRTKLVNEINNFPKGRLLEIGVGTGSYLYLFNLHKVTGIDISSKMLAVAKRKNPMVDFVQMDAEKLEFANESFDYVVLSHMIAVTTNPEQVLNEVFRVLKSNGKIIILNHFTPSNLLKYLDKAFNMFSSLFCFKSLFYLHNLETLKKFKLVKETSLGWFSYYKLLIYSKH